MQAFEPDFEIIKMDAEIGSYQEDYDPPPEGPDAEPAPPDSPAATLRAP